MSLSDLKPLPKPHYHWAVSENHWPGDDRMREIVRICGAASIDPGRQDADTMARIVGLGDVPVCVFYSAWHHGWNGKDANDEGAAHQRGLRAMFDHLDAARTVCTKLGRRVDCVAFDCEQWQASDANRAALTRKHNAAYDLAKMMFPDCIVDWYGSGVQRSASSSGWSDSVLFTGDERRDTYGCDLYTLPQHDRTRETYRRTVAIADERGISIVTPWVALGSGLRPQLDTMQRWEFGWDYDVIDSWTFGREINNAWFAERPNRFAPWHHARHVMLYPEPFRTGNWEKHFTAYCLGAAQAKRTE